MSGPDFSVCGRCSGPLDPGVRRCPYCGASATGARPAEGDAAVLRRGDEPVLSAPPRTVPISLVVASLFGGGMSRFGWLFTAFGMVLATIFGLSTDPGPLTAWAYTGRAHGITVGQRETAWTVGGEEDSPGTPIFATLYEFDTPDGVRQAGAAYATGEALEPGTVVEVQYVPGRPSMSRLQGMRNAPLPCWALLLLILPLVGLYCAFLGFRAGWKALRLFREGVMGRATLVSAEATNVTVNDRVVTKLTFTYRDDSGLEHELVTRTNRPESLDDEDEESVIYDPAAPADAVTVDNLPGNVRIGADGRFTTAAPRKALRSLVAPALALSLIALAITLLLT